MNKKLVIANWKMHGTQAANARLIEGLLPMLQGLDAVQVAICPPTPYLAQLTGLLADTGLAVGAQNLNERAQGAYTGEVSGQMLADLGCDYALVGHSERRSLFGESDAQVAARDPELAPRIALLYGGSVNADNAAELFAQQDIDGGLIGGASLDVASFSAICQAAGA